MRFLYQLQSKSAGDFRRSRDLHFFFVELTTSNCNFLTSVPLIFQFFAFSLHPNAYRMTSNNSPYHLFANNYQPMRC